MLLEWKKLELEVNQSKEIKLWYNLGARLLPLVELTSSLFVSITIPPTKEKVI